ncbi:hypothetical protein V8C86DRAFT_2534919 [Haematococcus lacustris]
MTSAVAVVLRPRQAAEHNVLVHMHGCVNVDLTIANEVARILERAASGDDGGDVASTIQGPPLTCGSLVIGRWRGTYRLVGAILVLVLVPLVTNTWHALHLLDKVVRVVTLDYQALELTKERVEKRYAEVGPGL